jgi:hypothetical protein
LEISGLPEGVEVIAIRPARAGDLVVSVVGVQEHVLLRRAESDKGSKHLSIIVRLKDGYRTAQHRTFWSYMTVERNDVKRLTVRLLANNAEDEEYITYLFSTLRRRGIEVSFSWETDYQ